MGRVLPEKWVFGGFCPATNDCFLVSVLDRSQETLTRIVLERVAEGSIIWSDSWAGYNNLYLHFQHLQVNHRYHFADPDSGAHT